MGDDDRMQVWFTPWSSAARRIELGPVSVLPGGEVLAILEGRARESLDLIFKAHRHLRGKPVETPAVYCLGENPLKPLNDQEARQVGVAAQLATFLALSGNDYLGQGRRLQNATHFTLVGQVFEPGDTCLAFGGRSRCGTVMDIGYDYKELALHAEPWAYPCSFDGGPDGLRCALRESTDRFPAWQKVLTAIKWFNLANTDSPVVDVESEVKLLSTAYEVIASTTAEIGKRKKVHIRSSLPGLLPEGIGSLPGWTASPKGGQPPEVQPEWTTFQFWWNDYFALRNTLEHEGRNERHTTREVPAWSLAQHLLVGTALFPHLVRGTFANRGLYSWTEEDKRNLRLLDSLLLIEDFRLSGHGNLEEHLESAADHYWRRSLERSLRRAVRDRDG